MLAGQLEDVVAELEGARLDAGLFAQLGAEQAALVRAALGEDAGTDNDEETPDDGEAGSSLADRDAVDSGKPEADDIEDDGVAEEILRLREALEASRRVQAALRAYLELLSAPPAA